MICRLLLFLLQFILAFLNHFVGGGSAPEQILLLLVILEAFEQNLAQVFNHDLLLGRLFGSNSDSSGQ